MYYDATGLRSQALMRGTSNIRKTMRFAAHVAERHTALTAAVTLTLVLFPALPALLDVLRLDSIYLSADSTTHLVRTLHARDYYLPSGHRWGCLLYTSDAADE